MSIMNKMWNWGEGDDFTHHIILCVKEMVQCAIPGGDQILLTVCLKKPVKEREYIQ